MALEIRPYRKSDRAAATELVIDAFEPITWFKKLDERFGPLNNRDWRERWEDRIDKVFREQIILVGEDAQGLAAFASGTYDGPSAHAFLDILAVAADRQGRGLGREMLRAWGDYLKDRGATSLRLDCLIDNDQGNDLYRSEGFQELNRSIHWFKKL